MEYDSNQVIFSIKDSGELVDPRQAEQEAEYYLVYASQEDRWAGNLCKSLVISLFSYLLQLKVIDIDHIYFRPDSPGPSPGLNVTESDAEYPVTPWADTGSQYSTTGE